MDRFLRDLIEHPGNVRPGRQWVGLYEMDTTLHERDGRVYILRIAGRNDAGFAYSTTRPGYAGVNAGDDGHLQGRWYWFSDD